MKRVKNWLLRTKEKKPLENIQEWDDEKAELINGLLNKRYDDELKIGEYFQKRAAFFITTLGVILTIILTTTIPHLQEWEDEIVISFVEVMFLLGVALALYFILYFRQTRYAYPKSQPSDDELNLYLSNGEITKRGIIQRQNRKLYQDIETAQKINNRTNFFFNIVDLLFLIGLGRTIWYAIQSAQFSQLILSYFAICLIFFLMIVFILIYFVLVIMMIPDVIWSVRVTIRIIKKLFRHITEEKQSRKQSKTDSETKRKSI